MPPQALSKYYSCTIERVLTGCIMAWYGNCSFHDSNALQPVVKTTEYIFFLINLHTITHNDKAKTAF
jgi:hypothetical protein